MGGFTPAELGRLAELKARHDRGAFREPSDAEQRLLFARWLVARGRLSEALDRRDGYADLVRLLARPWPRRKADARAVACRLLPRAR